MDKNKAKELSDILLAYSQGKLIQISNNGNQWVEWIATNPDSIFNYNYYRIKPQPKLVPFTLEDNKLFRDKWIKSKKNALPGVFRVISCNESNIHIEFGAIGYASLLDEFIFEDGSPCGKYITE